MDESTTTSDARSESGERAAPSAHNSAPSRAYVFALVSVALAVSGLVIALRYFVGERLPDLTEATLEAAMEKWDKDGRASYDMDIELRGARPGQIHVEVRDGKVTAHTRDGRVPNESTWATWSVPGLFETLARDLEIAANPQQVIQAQPGAQWWQKCEFDSQFGYPAIYHRVVTGGGPEVFWQVTSFQPK